MHSSKLMGMGFVSLLLAAVLGFAPKMVLADTTPVTSVNQPVAQSETSKMMQDMKDEIQKLKDEVEKLKKQLQERKDRAAQKRAMKANGQNPAVTPTTMPAPTMPAPANSNQ